MAPAPGPDGLTIAVISDTHDHLYPEVKELLDGVDHILHAGDMCSAGVLAELRRIAPVTAARGNCDTGSWADELPVRAEVELDGVRIMVRHIGGRLREEAAVRDAATVAGRPSQGDYNGRGFDVVVFGHSHQALEERHDGVLYLNPGSAGPRRFGRPRTMAFLRISPPDDGESSGRPEAAHRVTARIMVVEE